MLTGKMTIIFQKKEKEKDKIKIIMSKVTNQFERNISILNKKSLLSRTLRNKKNKKGREKGICT